MVAETPAANLVAVDRSRLPRMAQATMTMILMAQATLEVHSEAPEIRTAMAALGLLVVPEGINAATTTIATAQETPEAMVPVTQEADVRMTTATVLAQLVV